MKRKSLLLCSVTALVTCAQAQLTIPGANGADGPLIVSTSMGIDLSKATNGVWNDPLPTAGKGIYDSNKWAVVFRYSSVSIANGATLTFTNHPKHPPVVWLVSGDVTINGAISLDGQPGASDAGSVPEPGPGGFRGGAGIYNGNGILHDGSGFGPGGGYNNDLGEQWGVYSRGANAYGNAQILPLIGGSGGEGGSVANGGGAGGALLIAASNNITINGYIHANGGIGGNYGGNGSAGAIRLVGNRILGTGTVQAALPSPPATFGRIRLEAFDTSVTGNLSNAPPTVVTPSGNPATIWPPDTAPTARITKVATLDVTADPSASLNLGGGDLIIGNTNAIAVEVETVNFPTNGSGKVDVSFKPRNSAPYTIPAAWLNGDTNLAHWRATTILSNYYTVIQARAHTTN